ncbi:unnamed protein product [Rotaria sordida]|uniref:Uncharacterized protein n=1 Tax=Rotaria sordida TaxID=392033 RepID=A0A814U006_9BILA|nr:unnamed protein product [Rotaria sordida]CAF4326528.1 unnamed protein product [Rotaria sordida]
MSTKAPCDRHPSLTMDGRSSSINAGIDSGFTNDPAHRGSLTPSELDAIHQTNSFKQAKLLEEKDKHQLANKTKTIERTQSSKQ